MKQFSNLNETITNTKTTSIRDDECDVMGKHIAIQLRELPSYERVLANFDLQKVLMNNRLRNMRGVSPLTSYNPNSVASTIQSNPYTPQTTTSEESGTADIIHSAMDNSDINIDFFGSDVQYI